MQRIWLYFLAVIIIAILLRFVNLGGIPPSLTWDEVAWGYNAYSLGIDGRDEFGKLLPVTYLESFGDFKPPFYAYLDIIPVKVFGLNEFATRFPSAFFGVISVILTYFLVIEIFGDQKKKLAILSSLLMAISPWHIMLSRAAFEANVAHSLILLGIVLFLRSIRGKPYFLILSVVSFVAAMYTFNSARIVVPLLVFILLVIFYKQLTKVWKVTVMGIVVGFTIFLPLLFFLNTPQAQLRFNEVNIFSDTDVIDKTNQQMANDDNSLFSRIIHNRRFAYGVEYVRHYIDNITPNFLFVRGDGNPKFSIQDVGQLYMWEIPFLIGGALLLFRRREKYWYLLPVLLVVALIPAGFARETPHALRVENALPVFQILTALGVVGFLGIIPKKKKFLAGSIIGIVLFINFAYFLHNYITHYSWEFSGEWQYGYKESIEYVGSQKDNYETVYVTETLGRAYIYYLFYMKYDPRLFRQEAQIYREPLGFVHVFGFSNLKFTDMISQIEEKDALYISTPGEKPDDAMTLKEFKLLNGKVALVAYTR